MAENGIKKAEGDPIEEFIEYADAWIENAYKRLENAVPYWGFRSKAVSDMCKDIMNMEFRLEIAKSMKLKK